MIYADVEERTIAVNGEGQQLVFELSAIIQKLAIMEHCTRTSKPEHKVTMADAVNEARILSELIQQQIKLNLENDSYNKVFKYKGAAPNDKKKN